MVLRQIGKGILFISSHFPSSQIQFCIPPNTHSCTQDVSERESNVKEGVDKAKEAVAMDVKDGISWSKLKITSNEFTAVFHPLPHPSNHTVILGNAYLSLYFTNQQDSKILKQCISAYSQAVCIQIQQVHGQSCTERVQSCLEAQSVSTQRLYSSQETAQSVKKNFNHYFQSSAGALKATSRFALHWHCFLLPCTT